MGKVILNETEYNQFKHEALSLARALLSDKADYLDTINRLSSLRHKVGKNENDEDFEIFVAVSSETDHIPYGEIRNVSSESWLDKCDKELSEVKDFYKENIEKSCKSIISRFDGNTQKLFK